MKNIFFTFGLLFIYLLLDPSSGQAEIYKYKNEKGIWCYTDNPLDLPGDTETLQGTIESDSHLLDLKKQLWTKLDPRNALEEAAMATMVVQSSIGHGSGFFITQRGHILTNKHVLRLPESKKKQAEAYFDQNDAKIRQIQTKITSEQAELQASKSNLERLKSKIDKDGSSSSKRVQSEYAERLRRYQAWQQDFLERKKKFESELQVYRQNKDSFKTTHTIADLSRSFTIILADDTQLYVSLLAESDHYDLALLKLDGFHTPALKPADLPNILSGLPVYAVGNPLNLKNSVTSGIVSGMEGIYVKTNAHIYPGNSGGPLISESGQVIGINTFKQLTHKYEGLGFAIAIDRALQEFRAHLPRPAD